jgi:hypothetical protein
MQNQLDRMAEIQLQQAEGLLQIATYANRVTTLEHKTAQQAETIGWFIFLFEFYWTFFEN